MSEGLVCGLDEAGRGALAGPVVAAAVVLPQDFAHPLITDSKRLSPQVREELAAVIERRAVAWALGIAASDEVVSFNVLQASMLAMQRAFSRIGVTPRHIFVDGPHYPSGLPPGAALIRGDSRVLAVSAASILAKVYRDCLMQDYGRHYAQFSFGRHKGYATPQHLAELAWHKPVRIHRASFGPVARALQRGREHL